MVLQRMLQTLRKIPRIPRVQPSMIKWLSADTTSESEGERVLTERLKEKFPGAKDVKVQDISGGCGAMYEIYLEANEFQGKRKVMQHRMVNEALATEIAQMHGLRITTAVPSNDNT
ncbi:unnamed protein product [Owenia fusiformis]|uniref:Uncharacterized protein n=1 Tax=Owenia fusiformis TaxID=6347 RepID=A0A8J1UNY5_OWEFU|nr:unnamed protein product [Owenia fusiformis]